MTLITGKRRTRGHVLADLSANLVERHALLCGYSVERVRQDYGLDLLLFTHDRRGVIQNGYVALQLKASDRPRYVEDGTTATYALDTRDLLHWLNEPWPVILVVYDGTADSAYWLYVQQHFAARGALRPGDTRRTVTVHVPTTNVLDSAAVRQFDRYRAEVLRQVRKRIGHDR